MRTAVCSSPDAPGIGVELADDAEELYPAKERGSNAAAPVPLTVPVKDR